MRCIITIKTTIITSVVSTDKAKTNWIQIIFKLFCIEYKRQTASINSICSDIFWRHTMFADGFWRFLTSLNVYRRLSDESNVIKLKVIYVWRFKMLSDVSLTGNNFVSDAIGRCFDVYLCFTDVILCCLTRCFRIWR